MGALSYDVTPTWQLLVGAERSRCVVNSEQHDADRDG